MQFSSLDLAPDLLKALVACGYSTMTPVQEQAIVPARRGKDLQVTAQTGTGKPLPLPFRCYNGCSTNRHHG